MIQISVNNAKICYDNTVAAENITFNIEKGDYICIVGENGSGKSSLIKAILGLLPLKDGSIVYTGIDKSEIGYIPQKTDIQNGFPASVYEVVLSGRLKKRLFYSRADKLDAAEKMAHLGIDKIKNKCFGELSGGQAQRVLLARALCSAKSMLLLDEPLAGLDPKATREFYDTVKTLHREGFTVLMVSHDINSAVQYATKILHMGKNMLFFGTRSEYLASDLGRAFLGGDAK